MSASSTAALLPSEPSVATISCFIGSGSSRGARSSGPPDPGCGEPAPTFRRTADLLHTRASNDAGNETQSRHRRSRRRGARSGARPRALAGDRIEVEMVSPERDFVYRPLSVAEPFRVEKPAGSRSSASSKPRVPSSPARPCSGSIRSSTRSRPRPAHDRTTCCSLRSARVPRKRSRGRLPSRGLATRPSSRGCSRRPRRARRASRVRASDRSLVAAAALRARAPHGRAPRGRRCGSRAARARDARVRPLQLFGGLPASRLRALELQGVRVVTDAGGHVEDGALKLAARRPSRRTT